MRRLVLLVPVAQRVDVDLAPDRPSSAHSLDHRPIPVTGAQLRSCANGSTRHATIGVCRRGTLIPMAWIKIPPEHHPLFRAALPKDPRVETLQMFGGVAAKVNGHMFAGLFGRSTVVLLNNVDRTAALALDGADLFDPMGNGQLRSDKVMLPEDVFHEPAELRRCDRSCVRVRRDASQEGQGGCEEACRQAPRRQAPRRQAPRRQAPRRQEMTVIHGVCDRHSAKSVEA